jgi:hypothetical protein
VTDPRWSWVIAAMSAVSLYLLTRKDRWGHALGAVKEALFAVYALATHQHGFAVGETVFLVLFVRGFVLWSRPTPADEEVAP